MIETIVKIKLFRTDSGRRSSSTNDHGQAFGATAIYLSQLYDDDCGLLHSNGSVSPLYVPWRNTAWNTTGSEMVGQLQLAPHIREFCFRSRY